MLPFRNACSHSEPLPQLNTNSQEMAKMSAQQQPEKNRTEISGWFRITIVAIAACALFAAYPDDDGFLDRFGQYFVLAILAIVVIRSISFTADWIASGFNHVQLQKLAHQSKYLIAILGGSLALYLVLPLFRYGVVAAPGSDSSGSPARFIVLDRMTGEIHWLGHVEDRQRPRRHHI